MMRLSLLIACSCLVSCSDDYDIVAGDGQCVDDLDQYVELTWREKALPDGRLQTTLVAEPRVPVPLSLNFSFEPQNTLIEGPEGIFRFNPDDGRQTLYTLTQETANEPWNWEFSYGWNINHPGGARDGEPYRLPYRTDEALPVAQGYNGSFSHKGTEAYALDWNMPEGTPVLAARGGVVAFLCETSSEGGASQDFASKANTLYIIHDDGTTGTYVHFRKDGVVPGLGQRVETGDVIGYSGNTGWSTQPHLHFQVAELVDELTLQTVPVRFDTAEGENLELVQGQAYRPRTEN